MSEIPPTSTPAQIERLVWLMEECGEVVQAIGKILRYGYDSEDPTNRKIGTNQHQLMVELGDVWAAMTLLARAHEIDMELVSALRDVKLQRYGRWMRHQNED